MNLEVIITNDLDEVLALVEAGWCPVECSIGALSVTDALEMDHHGELSHLESVAVRAWRQRRGARAHDPRFVGVGVADADMTFAIAALAGLLPEGRDEEIASLAALIAKMDSEPIGLDLTSSPQGAMILMWQTLGGDAHDSLGAMGAVHLWRTLLAAQPQALIPHLEVARQSALQRQTQARAELERSKCFGPVLTIDGSRVWGFDVWYGRRPEGDFDRPEGWTHPVVVALAAHPPRITIGCPNRAVAEALFGPGGLKNIFPHLCPEGWGGREAVGGSPRHRDMHSLALEQTARQLQALLLPQTRET